MLMWQQRNLNEPAICTLKHESLQKCSDMLLEARRTLEEGTKLTEVHHALGCEVFVVKKLLYKSNLSLHNEKALQGLKQLDRSLRRLVELNPTNLMSRLLQLWPSVLTIHHGVELYLPSRQMLQFLLVRLVGCAALLHHIINRAALTFTAAMRQVTIGMQMKNMVVFSAAASRIWFLCRSMKKQMVEWYTRLLPLADLLTPTKAIWLKDGFEFPTDLGVWLGKEVAQPISMVNGHGPVDTRLSCDNVEPLDMDDLAGEVLTEAGHAYMKMEDVGEAVKRESPHETPPPLPTPPTLTDAVDSVGNKTSCVNQSSESSTIEETMTVTLKPFCFKFWSEKVKQCNTQSELSELLDSFQEQYGIKSKKCKECRLQLTKGNSRVAAERKMVMKCLKKVARIQSKKNSLEMLKYSVILETLQTTLSLPGGLRETAREVARCGVKRGKVGRWEVPPKAMPHVLRDLRLCVKRTRSKSKPKAMAVLAETAEKLARILAGPGVASLSKPLKGPAKRSGKTEKAKGLREKRVKVKGRPVIGKRKKKKGEEQVECRRKRHKKEAQPKIKKDGMRKSGRIKEKTRK